MSANDSGLVRQSRGLLSGPLKHVQGAALAAALAPLAAFAPSAADAGAAAPRTSRVDGTVTQQGSQFLYEFEVFNTTGYGGGGQELIVDWELPFFSLSDFDLNSVTSPVGWRHEIIANPTDANTQTRYYNNDGGEGGSEGPYGQYAWDYDFANDPLLDPNQGGDPNLYGPNPGVFNAPPFIIHWYTWDADLECFNQNFQLTQDEIDAGFCQVATSPVNPIGEGQSLDGFSFVSDFSSRNAPYLASWFREPPTQGDPPIGNQIFGLPDSPARQLAQGVPEPAVLGLFGMGLIGVTLTRLRRRR